MGRNLIPLSEGELADLMRASQCDGRAVCCAFGTGGVALIADKSPWAVPLLAEWRRMKMALTQSDHAAAIDAAENQVRDIERLISDEIYEARKAIEKRHDAALRAAQVARSEARAAKEAADIAESQSHPLVGKRVQRKAFKGGSSRTSVDQFGIVEVFTRESMVPLNQRYMRSSVGQPIVRILKKDGTPGTKIERLSQEWKAA